MKITVLFLLLLLSTQCFAGQYICVADMATGFSFNKESNHWKTTSFRTNQEEYVISTAKVKSYALKVTKVGDKHPQARCKKEFDKSGFLFCSGIQGEFKINKNNGRYLKIYARGYYNVIPSINGVTDTSSDTPVIEIGKCSPLKAQEN